MKIRTLIATAALMLAPHAHGAAITPTFDTFGDLAAATFGGTGIPTDPTAITTVVSGVNTITLGLTAHQRFANPALTNDGAGTFFAGAGANDGTPGNPGTAATWNFAWYIAIDGGASFEDFSFDLYYDLDPAAGTDEADLGVIDINDAIVALGGTLATTTVNQGSQNASFNFLTVAAFGVTPPAFSPFDPDATGEYSFALVASDGQGEVGRSAINVVVPAPASIVLLALGLAGFGAVRRGMSV